MIYGNDRSFLIIGAMKAGSTSLYEELRLHPEVFVPENKEPNSLCNDRVLSGSGRREYARLFQRAGEGQVKGEASTAYTKAPDVEGVPGRAREVWGAELKIIYVTRDPVARAISHYEHDRQLGLINTDFTEAVKSYSRYTDYSAYDYQIAPWEKVFGKDAILRVCFEEYVNQRQVFLNKIAMHLDISPSGFHGHARHANRSSGRLVPNFWIRRFVVERAFYLNVVKPGIPEPVRMGIKRLVSRKMPAGVDRSELSDDIVRYINQRVDRKNFEVG